MQLSQEHTGRASRLLLLTHFICWPFDLEIHKPAEPSSGSPGDLLFPQRPGMPLSCLLLCSVKESNCRRPKLEDVPGLHRTGIATKLSILLIYGKITVSIPLGSVHQKKRLFNHLHNSWIIFHPMQCLRTSPSNFSREVWGNGFSHLIELRGWGPLSDEQCYCYISKYYRLCFFLLFSQLAKNKVRFSTTIVGCCSSLQLCL